MKRVIFVLLISLLTIACSTPRKELAKTGLFDEHQILRIEQVGLSPGRVVGKLLGPKTALSPESILQFYWELKPGKQIVTSLPTSKVEFIINDGSTVPSMELVFKDSWANNIRIPGLYDEESDLEDLNFNDLISENLSYAVVRISKKDFENKIYLTKIGG